MADDHVLEHAWRERGDGARERVSNGIRIIDRTSRAEIEHLVAGPGDGGTVVILGLDRDCRAVYTTTLGAEAAE